MSPPPVGPRDLSLPANLARDDLIDEACDAGTRFVADLYRQPSFGTAP